MRRIYKDLFQEHLSRYDQMLFIEGPRQVGKTTIAQALGEAYQKSHYLTWDDSDTRILLTSGPKNIARALGLEEAFTQKTLIIFDELHKYADWKSFLKGFYDLYKHRVQIVVTGSAKLGVYKKGGDSLMGRYFPYRIHPLSVGELIPQQSFNTQIRPPHKIEDQKFENLLNFGGFPEPFLKHDMRFWNQWCRLRDAQMIQEDIRDLTTIQEVGKVEILNVLLKEQVGGMVSNLALGKKLSVSSPSIARWLDVLSGFYVCFRISPWSSNITRSLIKEPKIYLWDWSQVRDPGARYENFIASHLLKFVHFWTDMGAGDFDLHYLRNKDKQEVDFLVTRDKKPWFMVEAKTSKDKPFSIGMEVFRKQLNCPFCFQVILNMDYVDRDCFEYTEPVKVPASTFLSQLI